MKLAGDIPLNVCVCSVCNNFELVLHSLNTISSVILINSYKVFLCADKTESCFKRSCIECEGGLKFLNNLRQSLNLDMTIEYKMWVRTEDKFTRTEKKKMYSTVRDGLNNIEKTLESVLKHIYVKKHQSAYFKMSITSPETCCIQIDFSENFHVFYQNETQAAHYGYKQITIFTVCIWYAGHVKSAAIVSNNLSHSKDTVIVYVYKILSKIISEMEDYKAGKIRDVEIFSDNAWSQFKNKFIMAALPVLQNEFNLNIKWNFFQAQHGKGAVDGIGASVKSTVSKQIIARDIILADAEGFMNMCTQTKVEVIYMSDAEITTIFSELDLSTIFKNARNIPNISKNFQFLLQNGKIIGRFLSN